MKNLTIFASFIILFLVGFVWFNLAISPKAKIANYKNFLIEPGSSLSEISKRLQKEGFVKNSFAFQILVVTKGVARKIQAGSYSLSPHLSASAIVEILTKGTFDVWVTIPEGLRVEEIAEILASKLDIQKDDFLKVSKEGYMFPDTYLIPKDAKVATIAKMMRDNFEKKVSGNLKEQIEATGLTLNEVIILASIVEREVKFDVDRPIVSGILLKRLKEGVALSADATVQYAAGFSELEKSWWRKTLVQEDLNIDSPYNTRKFVGLPPTPICNPGLASIKAVITPQASDFFYYLSDKEGKMHYARTLSEHNENIKKYL